MTFQLPPPDDRLLSAVLAWGLQFGVFLKNDMIAWADAEIERRSEVPTWLIDLSMSNAVGPPRIELQRVLHDVGRGADKEHVCICIYSSVPDLAGYSFEECHHVCRKLYEIVLGIFKDDSGHRLLMEISNIDDAFYTNNET